MKKLSKVLIVTMALAMVLAFMPAATFAASTAPISKTVYVNASSSWGFDLTDKAVTAQSDMAETYLGQTEATATDVTVLDAIVAAHIAKYGAAFKNNPGDYLTMSDKTSSAYVTKMFGHSIVGLFYIGDKAIDKGVTQNTVASGDVVSLCSYGPKDTSYNGLYSYFDSKNYSTKAGTAFNVTLKADNWGTAVIPSASTIQSVDATTGDLSAMSYTTNTTGVASLQFNTPGTYYISAKGQVTYAGYGGASKTGDIMAPIAKVSVGLNGTVAKLSSKKAKSVKVSWGKVTGATSYKVYRATKKSGKYKLVKSTSAASFTNTKLKKGAHYYYKVKAVNGSYTSVYSNIVKK